MLTWCSRRALRLERAQFVTHHFCALTVTGE